MHFTIPYAEKRPFNLLNYISVSIPATNVHYDYLVQLNQGRFQKTILAYAKPLDTTTAPKCYNNSPCKVIRKYIYIEIEQK